MAVAEADLVVNPSTSGTAYADLVVDAAPPSGAARATADLVVSPSVSTPSRAYADLVVSPPVTSGGRAQADLTVTAPASALLYRWDPATTSLKTAYLARFVNGQVRGAQMYQWVNGQLVPQVNPGGGAALAAPTATATIENGRSVLTWNGVSGATSYKVTRNGTGSDGQGPLESTEAATARTKTFTNLSNGVAYTLSVQPLPAGPVTNVTVTPSSTSTTSVRKPIIGIGGGPRGQQFLPLHNSIGPFKAWRSYESNHPANWSQTQAANDFAGGIDSYWSFKPNMTTFATNTAAHNAFSAFLDTIPAGHRVTIVCLHEPEDNIYDGEFTIQQYGAVQNKVADLVHQKNNPNLRFGPCWMSSDTWATTSRYYTWINGPVKWTDVMDFSKFDFLGIDPYRTTDGSRTLEQLCTVNNNGAGTGGSALSMFAWLTQFDLPIVIAEWGFFRKQPDLHTNAMAPVNPFPDSQVAAWITDAYDFLKRWNAAHPPRATPDGIRGSFVDAALWYNYTLQGSDNPLDRSLDGSLTFPLKTEAYRQVTADSKIAAGGQTPTASFSAAPLSGSVPLTVTFSNGSSGSPTSYTWQFGDGTTSTAVNPTKTYTVGGRYTVTLTARNQYGVSVASRVNYIEAS